MSYAMNLPGEYAFGIEGGIQIFFSQSPNQYIFLSGGIAGSSTALQVDIQDRYGATQKVNTNGVILPGETTASLIGRVILASSRQDFFGVLALALPVYRLKSLTTDQGRQVMDILFETARTQSGQSPSLVVAVGTLDILYAVSRWTVESNVFDLDPVLEKMCSLIIWVTTASDLKYSAISEAKISRYIELADNIYATAADERKWGGKISLIRETLDLLRITSFQARLTTWTKGERFVQVSGGLGFKSTIHELNGTQLNLSQYLPNHVSDSLYLSLSQSGFDSPLNASLNSVGKDLADVVVYETNETELRPQDLAMISGFLTLSITAPSSSLSVVGSLELVGFVHIHLAFDITFLSLRVQQKVISEKLIECVRWNHFENTTYNGTWDNSDCSVLSITQSQDSSGFLGKGSLVCSCTRLGTFAATLVEIPEILAANSSALNPIIRWAIDSPQDQDEIVVSSGEEVMLKIAANSFASSLWGHALSQTTRGQFIMTINQNLVGSDADSTAYLSGPVVSYNYSSSHFVQRAEWILKLSSEWTRGFAENKSEPRDTIISALLVGETSGDRLRRWKLRVLNCDVIVSRGDGLNSLSARYGTSPRIIFSINPSLKSWQALYAPSQEIGERWTCSTGQYCSNSHERAGGTRVLIGRMVRVSRDSSVVQQVRGMGGSLMHIAEVNLGKIKTISTEPLIYDLAVSSDSREGEICMILHEDAMC